MRNLINIPAILLVAINTVSAIDSPTHPSFKNWKEEHGIIYDTYQEHIYREQIYLNNIKMISKLNDDNDDTAFYAVNKFADMSRDEFRTKILLPTTNTTNLKRSRRELSFGEVKESSASIVTHHHPLYNSNNKNNNSTNSDYNDIPDTIDWRDKGAVTKVKDQGNLGTCWAFSTVGNIESQLFLKHGKLIDLSVEQLLECDSISSMDKADCGMFGGWPELAYQYLISSGGLFSDQDWPYCSQFPSKSPDHCFPCMANSYSKENCGDHSDLYCDPETTLGQRSKNPQCTNINIKKGKTVSLSKWSKISEDENEIAKSLATIGPLSILINASKLQFYKGGIVNSKFCNPDALNHAVLLVGYDVDAWIIKNSWSEKWGENGYVRLARGDGTCGLNKAVTTSYVQ